MGDTIDEIGNKLATEINKSNLFVAQYNGRALTLKPAMKGLGRTWAVLNYEIDTFNGVPDPTLTGPSVPFAALVDVTGNITP